MATLEITQNELVEALAKANAAPSEARTVNELVVATGWTPTRVRMALGKLSAAGRVEIHQVLRLAINGMHKRVPAYTIKPAPKRRT